MVQVSSCERNFCAVATLKHLECERLKLAKANPNSTLHLNSTNYIASAKLYAKQTLPACYWHNVLKHCVPMSRKEAAAAPSITKELAVSPTKKSACNPLITGCLVGRGQRTQIR